MDQILPLVRQYMAIIDIRKTGAHVSEESIKPYFNWLMQWPQALDIKWLPAWRLAPVLLYSTSKWYWLLFLASCCLSSKKIFLKILTSAISLSSSKSVLEQFQTHPSRVGCTWLLPPSRCRASFGLCLRMGMTQGVFLKKTTAWWLKSQPSVLEVERSWVWVHPGEIYLAAFGQAGHVLTALRAHTSIHGQGEEGIPSNSLCLRPHLCLQPFVPVIALLPSPQT